MFHNKNKNRRAKTLFKCHTIHIKGRLANIALEMTYTF